MSSIKRLLKMTRRLQSVFILGIFCTAMVNLLVAAVIIPMKVIIDELSTKHLSDFRIPLFEFIGLYLIKWIFTYGQTVNVSAVTNGVAAELRDRVYEHLQSLSLSYFDRNKTGQLMSRLTNDISLIQSSAQNVISAITGPLQIIFGFIGMIYLQWRLALLTVGFAFAMWRAVTLISRKLRKLNLNLQTTLADVSALLQETLSGVRVIKSFAMEDYEIARFKKWNYQSYRAAMRLVRRQALMSPTTEFIGALAVAALLWYGHYLVLQGTMTFGQLAAFAYLGNMVSTGARGMGQLVVTYHQISAGSERIFEVLDETTEIEEKRDAYELQDVAGNVKFENVSFTYSGDRDTEVLTDISFEIPVGGVVALVGPSGSGKSTIASLLLRLYEPSSGEITVDDENIRDVTLKSLRRQIGIVPQDTILFSGTIRDNIAYSNPDASEESIIEAAAAANVLEFTDPLKDGLNTVVGDRGVRLSGGQRQRIAIARALLKNPPILVLDEATSSLDVNSEHLVQQALDSLMQKRTTLVIAHRLSTIVKADLILVLQNGSIVEMGNFAALQAKDGLFANLYRTQFQQTA